MKGYFPLSFGQTSVQLQVDSKVGWRRLKFKITLQQLNKKKARYWWFLKDPSHLVTSGTAKTWFLANFSCVHSA